MSIEAQAWQQEKDLKNTGYLRKLDTPLFLRLFPPTAMWAWMY